jgi:DNA mismatch repair protein MutH
MNAVAVIDCGSEPAAVAGSEEAFTRMFEIATTPVEFAGNGTPVKLTELPMTVPTTGAPPLIWAVASVKVPLMTLLVIPIAGERYKLMFADPATVGAEQVKVICGSNSV